PASGTRSACRIRSVSSSVSSTGASTIRMRAGRAAAYGPTTARTSHGTSKAVRARRRRWSSSSSARTRSRTEKIGARRPFPKNGCQAPFFGEKGAWHDFSGRRRPGLRAGAAGGRTAHPPCAEDAGRRRDLTAQPRRERLAVHDRDGEAHRRGHGRHRRPPRNERQPARPILDERGAALDPVAVVAIEEAVDRRELGLMDVAANDAVDAGLSGRAERRILEALDVAAHEAEARFYVLREGPVRPAADVVQPMHESIELEQ